MELVMYFCWRSKIFRRMASIRNEIRLGDVLLVGTYFLPTKLNLQNFFIERSTDKSKVKIRFTLNKTINYRFSRSVQFKGLCCFLTFSLLLRMFSFNVASTYCVIRMSTFVLPPFSWVETSVVLLATHSLSFVSTKNAVHSFLAPKCPTKLKGIAP